MVLCWVQRSGRTSILATTRSFSASMKTTPFNSAKGIFLDCSNSSGVMVSPGASEGLPAQWSGQVKQAMTTEVMDAVTMPAGFGMIADMHFPPRRIVCLTEETVETLYLLGE